MLAEFPEGTETAHVVLADPEDNEFCLIPRPIGS